MLKQDIHSHFEGQWHQGSGVSGISKAMRQTVPDMREYGTVLNSKTAEGELVICFNADWILTQLPRRCKRLLVPAF